MQISFDIYNTDAVERLREENPDILPTYTVDSDEDLAYNKNQINSAIKTARTAITCAQNAGNLDSFYKAQEMGIDTEKQWVCTQDDRTRESHLELDGEHIPLDDEFSNGLQYPGDPSGDPGEVYNCRCTMVAYFPDSDTRGAGDSEESEEDYEEWLEEKNEEAREEEVAVERVDNFISTEAEKAKIDYQQVYRYIEQPSEEQIIAKLTTIDSGGSCQSVALAYCGQKAGYNVTDYRGGKSANYFSEVSTFKKITYLDGVKSASQYSYTPLETVKEMLKAETKKEKEYVLSAGKHTAVIKRTGSKSYKYLEFQYGRMDSGWKPLTESSIKKRFKIPETSKWGQDIIIIDVDSLADCKEFPDILGYINTK